MKSKKQLILAALLVGVIVLVGAANQLGKQTSPNRFADVRNGSYEIDGKQYELKDGKYEAEIMSGTASRTVVQFFGNEKTGDLNGDGKPDQTFLLTKNDGGSGTFYYIAAALSDGSRYIGTNAILLGDRIAPQTTEIRDLIIVVNYAERHPEEPMTASPSVGVSRYFRVNGNKLEPINL